MMAKRIVVVFFIVLLAEACGPSSTAVVGVAGKPGQQSPVERDTEGNVFGYYEYLPQNFDQKDRHPLIFYWNGANTVTGNGRDQLPELLAQGLPQNIDGGLHYPAIIISPQVKKWKNVKIKGFVDYILMRYQKNIDANRIYMTGFSAGGGITMRYARQYPTTLAAIVPIAPAIYYPKDKGPTAEMAKLPTWLFHNKGDAIVEAERSIQWHHALKKIGGDHRLTIYPEESHYAWQQAYSEDALWAWLLSQSNGSSHE